jgi:predicted nuclease of predicted toxin-antitoxin system
MILLLDMNLSPAWSIYLDQNGIEARHWSSLGPATATDVDIMRYAAEHGFHVVTNDLDFGSILAATQGRKPSVIQIRSDNLGPQTIGPSVVAALKQMEAALNDGALLTIDPKRIRVRLLPLEKRN